MFSPIVSYRIELQNAAGSNWSGRSKKKTGSPGMREEEGGEEEEQEEEKKNKKNKKNKKKRAKEQVKASFSLLGGLRSLVNHRTDVR